MNYEKDRPWAWKSVVGGFLVYFQLSAVFTSYSIIYDDVKTFYSVQASTASLPFAVLMALRFLLGPFIVVIIRQLGCDTVTVIGGCLIALGLFVASCSSNIVLFVFSYGFVVGFGISMTYISMTVILSELFDKRKSLAFGLTTLGFYFGHVISPHLFTFFYSQYGFRSAIMVLSAFSLHSVVGGLLFARPKRACALNKKEPLLANGKQCSHHQAIPRKLQSCGKSHFNIEPLKNQNVLCFIIGVTLFVMGSIPWILYIVDIIHSDGEIGLNVALQTFTVEGVAQIISQIPVGFLFDRISRYRGIIVSLCIFLLSTVSTLLVTVPSNIYAYLTLSVFRGLCVCTFFVQHIVILGDICPPHLLPMTIGIMNFFAGIGTIAGPIISGLIRDRFSSYLETFLFLSANQFLAGALMLFVFGRKLWQNSH